MSETKGHDSLCISQECLSADRFCDCERVARIRADEREQIANGGIKWVADRALADLRAEVEALPFGSLLSPHAPACPGRPGYRGICNCERLPRQYLWRADVLALLGEEVDRG